MLLIGRLSDIIYPKISFKFTSLLVRSTLRAHALDYLYFMRLNKQTFTEKFSFDTWICRQRSFLEQFNKHYLVKDIDKH